MPKTKTKNEIRPSIDTGFRLISRKLSRPTPGDLIQQREAHKGGKMLDYIEVWTAMDALDDVDPSWTSEVKNVYIVGKQLVMVVSITLTDPATGKQVTKQNVGFEEIADLSYGDTSSNAFAMAFKRTVASFGFGRDLYKAPNFKPFRLATEHQLSRLIELMETGAIPEVYHKDMVDFIESGHYEYNRAKTTIDHYSKPENFGKKVGEKAEEKTEQDSKPKAKTANAKNNGKGNGKPAKKEEKETPSKEEDTTPKAKAPEKPEVPEDVSAIL